MNLDNVGKILGASDQTSYLLTNFKTVSVPLLVLDVLIVAVLFYWVYLFLRETRAIRILYGLFLLLTLVAIGRLFNLILLNWLLQYLTTVLIVAIPVVFQPELRTALEKLGRAKFVGDLYPTKERSINMIDEVVAASISLSKSKIGGLIIIQRQTGLREYIENGATINGVVSRDLLLAIFYPKSPLHDGAAIISGNRVVAARCILPVSTIPISSSLGTRHKAGVGVTENSDAVAIIISEETGTISISISGKMERRINEERLKNRLIGLLRQKKD